MLSIRDIRENPEQYRQGFLKRGLDGKLLDELLELDRKKRDLQFTVEDVKRQKNEAGREIGKCKQEGRDASEIIENMQKLGQKGKENEELLKQAEEKLSSILSGIPNMLDSEVQAGETEEDNTFIRDWGEKPVFEFQPLAHHELGEKLGMLDLERAGKIAGSRFAVLYDGLALLEWALMRFMIDIQVSRGYRLILPPFMVNSRSMYGTGQLPKFEEDLFKCKDTDYYLIPTAEVPVTNLHAGEILDGEKLPLRYCAFTPCFRSEAGSYGKDVKGFLRQHQFNKVELVRFTLPENSSSEHEQLVSDAEEVLKKLGLPYRIMLLCSKDTGFSAARCYDIEVWLPGENRYREISSCSNFREFQARRAGIRFRREEGKPEFVHTLNGSGLAVGRTVIAIMENFQQEDGSILIPDALQPYMGCKVISPKQV